MTDDAFNTMRHEDQHRLVDTKVQNRFRDHIADLPILEAEYAQLGAGSAQVLAHYFSGKDIIIVRTAIEPKFVAHCFIDPDWLGLMIPLKWRGDYVFNGIKANPNDLFVSAGASGYAATGSNRETISIALRRSRLYSTMRALRGNPSDPVEFCDQRIALGATTGTHFHNLLATVMRSATRIALGEGRFGLSESVENDLFSDLGDLFLDQLYCSRSPDPGRIDALRIVSAAKRALDDRQPAAVSMTNLCEASGVGKTWLHKCFVEVYGRAPQAYLRAHRLTMARENILCPHDPPKLIKQAALSLGFVNFGRFAAEYRARFGESPSQTLKNNPGST